MTVPSQTTPPATDPAAPAPPSAPPADAPSADSGAPPAGPEPTADNENEDWIRTASWDVRFPDGTPVDTLDGLATVLGTDRDTAAQRVLDLPFGEAAPEAIKTEAQAVRDGTAPGGEPGAADGTTPPDPNAAPAAGDKPDGTPPIPGAPVTTPPAPTADGTTPPEGKGKFNPKAKGGPPITRGTYVKVGDKQGRVDMVVTNGKVPGIEGDVEGSASDPAVRVVVYTESDGSWKATGEKIGSRVSKVKRTAPLRNRPAGKKDAGLAALVGLQADHEAKAAAEGWPEHAKPDGEALVEVFERGTKSWPGDEVTDLDIDEWGIGRVKAFLATAAGDRPEGYHRDDDLLPAGHPETKRAPVEPETPVETVTLDPAEVKARIAAQRGEG